MLFDTFWLGAFLLPSVLASQPSAPEPVEAPLRNLPWGQLNFLHTTDSHGWHGGHLQEAQYSADWGDYISFAHHLHQKADDHGTDLLLVDTGDRVEGNGLYDASNPKGAFTFDIVKQQQIDIITSGNHELYKKNSSDNEFHYTVPNFKDAYIASNLDIYNPDTGKLQPLAQRFRKFTTKNQAIRILAFGFLFDFQGNANNTVVQRVEDTVKEKWFQDAIRHDDVDLFVVAGHVPVSDSRESDAIFQAIRQVQPDAPIAFFGGHTHIRDYHKFDENAYGLESGRYMETLGFMSVSGLRSQHKETASRPAEFRRRYIDNNLWSMYRHSSKNASTFATKAGQKVSASIAAARKHLNLDHAYGCAPQDYWLNRAPYPSESSILTWLEKEVLPDTARESTNTPQLIITNSGAIRFDIFKGPFTIDTTYLVSPFTSGFRRLENVPYKAAKQLLALLNNEGKIMLSEMMIMSAVHRDLGKFTPKALSQLAPPNPSVSSWTREGVEMDTDAFRISKHDSSQEVLGKASEHGKPDTPLPLGYTTIDDAGNDGDDTIHTPIRFYDVPNCIQAEVNFPSDTKHVETVDIVYNEFIEKWILLGLRFLGEDYGVQDAKLTFDGASFTEVLSEWVHKHWAC
jgi:2',3'-cyclic-nucleotide 2'-phosphodiesterase (5'-nucleotidase family)